MTYEEMLCDANNLYKAYLASVKGSKWKNSSQRFSLNYLRYIFQIQKDIMDRTLKNGVVDEFELHERGHVRPISSLRTQDRVIRHVLCDEILLPVVRNKIIYDNGASIKGRGISFSRKRFDVHLQKYYKAHGRNGYILFGDFSKFYDNIVHEIAKADLVKLFDDDEFMEWLLTLIFEGFRIDVSYMTDEEYLKCMGSIFNKLEYRKIPKEKLTGEKFMEKSVNIGDQISQILGIYYPHRIDTYVKYVRSQKFYGRYMDDWYIINQSKEELIDLLENIRMIAASLGIHINEKKTKIVPIDRSFKYLQITYTMTESGKIYKKIDKKKVTVMRRKLKKLAVKVNQGDLKYEAVEEMFRSWMCNYYKLMSRDQRRNMLSLYEELFGKTIRIKKKKMEFLGGDGHGYTDCKS